MELTGIKKRWSEETKAARDLINSNKVVLIQKAITLATDAENPNIACLLKLLDKILPSLVRQELSENSPISDIPQDKIKTLLTEFSKYDLTKVRIEQEN